MRRPSREVRDLTTVASAPASAPSLLDAPTRPGAALPLPRQGLCVLVAADDLTRLPALPGAIAALAVLKVEGAGVVCRTAAGQIETHRFAPAGCLGLFATRATGTLMAEVRAWMLRQGAQAPEIQLLDRPDAPPPEAALLDSLLRQTQDFARLASEQAQHLAALRVEVETLASVRSDLDRFIGDLGIARLLRVFATGEPDFETQIELTPGTPLQQFLPLASTGFAAIDIACVAAPKHRAALKVRLACVEEDRTLAEWHVPPPSRDGWIRLGLVRACAGLNRSLVLIVESASTTRACANLALSGYQPLAAAQLCEHVTGQSVAPHALALKAYAAVPGSTPPHEPDTLLPLAETPRRVPPFAQRRLPVETLCRAVAEAAPVPQESQVPAVLYLREMEAVAIRAGATVRIPDACPVGSRGFVVTLRMQGPMPAVLEVNLWTRTTAPLGDGNVADDPPRCVRLGDSDPQDITILLPQQADQTRDIWISVAVLGALPLDQTWAILSDVRIAQ